MFAQLLYRLLRVAGSLPMSWLHAFSSCVAWFLRVVLKYRREVVLNNLRSCFPEAKASDINRWAKDSYVHLTDVIMEMIRGISMPGEELDIRMKLIEEEKLVDYIKNHPGEGGIVLATHYGNFEWVAFRLDRWFHQQGIPTSAIYAQLSHGTADALMRRVRGRWGANLIPKRYALIHTLRMIRERHMVGFMTDQSPVRDALAYELTFLGRQTRWLQGAVRLGAKIDGPVFVADVKRMERGTYELRLIPVSNLIKTAEDKGKALMLTYIQILEARIREAPGYWLWSHKRWKEMDQAGRQGKKDHSPVKPIY